MHPLDDQQRHRHATASARELPPPDADAIAHSERLLVVIREALAANHGVLNFADYMALALYAPGLGYYSAGSRKLGAEGDFVTAPELSPLFSRTLARQCAELLEELGGGEILEFGAGSGVMASDILLELERLGQLPTRYSIIEVSGDLRERQQQTLKQRAPHLAERVVWLDRLPEQGICGVVLANEVLDAMPVELFEVQQGRPVALTVTEQAGRFVFQAGELPAASRSAIERLCQEQALGEGYRSEFNRHASDWVRGLSPLLARGVVLLIDYGFPRAEYYHPERRSGTLMCHYRHRGHDDPLILPGLQDITAHVDFTAVADTALEAGFEVLGFASQANFLIANGLLALAADEEGDLPRQLEAAAQLKRLTLPGEMGELFKVMALGRGVERPLSGFALRDERGRL